MSRRQFERTIKIDNNSILLAKKIAENAELKKISESSRASEFINVKTENISNQ